MLGEPEGRAARGAWAAQVGEVLAGVAAVTGDKGVRAERGVVALGACPWVCCTRAKSPREPIASLGLAKEEARAGARAKLARETAARRARLRS